MQDDIISNFLKDVEEPVVDTSPATFPARLAEALEKRQPADPHQHISLQRATYELQDIPSQVMRASYGYGHFPGDVRRREHLTRPDALPWAYTPETCLVAGAGSIGVWIDDAHLCCPGCGLDFT